MVRAGYAACLACLVFMCCLSRPPAAYPPPALLFGPWLTSIQGVGEAHPDQSARPARVALAASTPAPVQGARMLGRACAHCVPLDSISCQPIRDAGSHAEVLLCCSIGDGSGQAPARACLVQAPLQSQRKSGLGGATEDQTLGGAGSEPLTHSAPAHDSRRARRTRRVAVRNVMHTCAHATHSRRSP